MGFDFFIYIFALKKEKTIMEKRFCDLKKGDSLYIYNYGYFHAITIENIYPNKKIYEFSLKASFAYFVCETKNLHKSLVTSSKRNNAYISTSPQCLLRHIRIHHLRLDSYICVNGVHIYGQDWFATYSKCLKGIT